MRSSPNWSHSIIGVVIFIITTLIWIYKFGDDTGPITNILFMLFHFQLYFILYDPEAVTWFIIAVVLGIYIAEIIILSAIVFSIWSLIQKAINIIKS